MSKQGMTPELVLLAKQIAEGTITPAEAIHRLETVRTKGDPLEGWTGSPPFHLDRSPMCDCGAETTGKWADKHSPDCASLK